MRIRLPRAEPAMASDAPVQDGQDPSAAVPPYAADTAVTTSGAAAAPAGVELHP